MLSYPLPSKNRAQPKGRIVTEEVLQRLLEMFQILADQSRLRLVLTLMRDGEQHVSALCQRLGQPQPAVSFHLKRMHQEGLLLRRRQGKFCFYSLCPRFEQEILSPLFTKGQGQLRLNEMTSSSS